MSVVLLWHMHQPLYREPETGEYLMPWVRLHATRAYYDMAWMLERHPGIRCTVNFSPVLLEQLAGLVGADVEAQRLGIRHHETVAPEGGVHRDRAEALDLQRKRDPVGEGRQQPGVRHAECDGRQRRCPGPQQ